MFQSYISKGETKIKKSLMLAVVLVAIGVVGTAFAFYGPWVRPEPGISCIHEIATMGYGQN